MPQSAAAPSTRSVLRWGEAGLWAGLVGGLALAFGLAWAMPGMVWLLPAGILGLVVARVLFAYPDLNLLVVLAGFAIALNPNPGVQLPELVYGLYYLAYLAWWYGRKVLSRTRFVRTLDDRIVAFLLVAGPVLSVVMGAVLGYPLDFLRTEFQGFLMLAFFFPVKELCRRHPQGVYLVFAVVVWLGAFVSVRNFLSFREVVLGATQLWQVADTRAGFNELHMTIASLGLLVLLLIVRRNVHRAALLGLFLLTFTGLILTKSRAFWVAFALGVVVLVVLFDTRERWRLVGLFSAGVAISAVLAVAFFGDLVYVFFEGLVNRFGTLETATTKDVSLVNRFNEAAAVWERIKANPILGYGMGAPYDYYSWVYQYTSVRTFVHIGYLGVWYKFGLWGLGLLLLFWARVAWKGVSLHASSAAPHYARAMGLFGAAALTAMTLTTITHNPFFTMDTMLEFTMVTGMVAGMSERYVPAERGGEALAA